MLQKRIDLGSQPYGLAIAGEDIVKGSAVFVKVVAGELKAFYPTTEAEANDVKGFATRRVETAFGSDKEHDVIKAGQRFTIQTLVKDNIWATSQFVGTPAKETGLVVGFTDATDKGKLRARTAGEVTASRPVKFTVFELGTAGSGYTDALVEVNVK